MEVMWFIVGLIIGVIVGIIGVVFIFRQKPVGTLRIDTSDPDGPYPFLELPRDGFYKIQSKKQVVLNVSTESYISHK